MVPRQRFRPRRHRGPPPDAPPRRLLRARAPVPRRATSSPPSRARASSTWPPTTARTISCCARRTASNPCSRSRATGGTAPTGAWLGGQGSVINAKFNAPDGPICSRPEREARALLAASADYAHSYPHSWRSHAKLIFRATPQWFIPMDVPVPPRHGEGDRAHLQGVVEGQHPAPRGASPLDRPSTMQEHGPPPRTGEDTTLREKALTAIAATRWIPAARSEPHHRDGRRPPRLGDQPPARVGGADHFVRRPADGRVSARRGGQRAHRRGRARRRRGRVVGDRPGGVPRQRPRRGGL